MMAAYAKRSISYGLPSWLSGKVFVLEAYVDESEALVLKKPLLVLAGYLLGGHFKTGQRGTPQNRPIETAGQS